MHFIDGAENYKSVFKIGSINQLLLEIKKKMKLNLDPQNIRPGMSVHDILESDMFGRGLGCMVMCILSTHIKLS